MGVKSGHSPRGPLWKSDFKALELFILLLVPLVIGNEIEIKNISITKGISLFFWLLFIIICNHPLII